MTDPPGLDAARGSDFEKGEMAQEGGIMSLGPKRRRWWLWLPLAAVGVWFLYRSFLKSPDASPAPSRGTEARLTASTQRSVEYLQGEGQVDVSISLLWAAGRRAAISIGGNVYEMGVGDLVNDVRLVDVGVRGVGLLVGSKAQTIYASAVGLDSSGQNARTGTIGTGYARAPSARGSKVLPARRTE